MSSNSEVQMVENTENKPKIMTGYIHYNQSDDLSQLFETLNEFRKNYGLKYSHQGNVGMIFFNINSEHLEAFSKVRPFKISKFQTKSEYTCDKETADKLMQQRDSFVRMNWDEQTNILTFMSRTTSRVHGNLVRRIFKDSEQTFEKNNYKVLRDYSRDDVHEQENTPETTATASTPASAPEGFQRVERRYKKQETDSRRFQSKQREAGTFKPRTVSKVVRESGETSRPKVRGIKVPRNNA